MQIAWRSIQAPSDGPKQAPSANRIPQEVIDVLSTFFGEIIESPHNFRVLSELFLLLSDLFDYLSRFGFILRVNVERTHVIRKVVESSIDIQAIWIDATLHWLVFVNPTPQGALSVFQKAASTVYPSKTDTHFSSGEVNDRMLMARHNFV